MTRLIGPDAREERSRRFSCPLRRESVVWSGTSRWIWVQGLARGLSFEFAAVLPGRYVLGPSGERYREVKSPPTEVFIDGLTNLQPIEHPIAALGQPIVVPRNQAELRCEVAVWRHRSIHGRVVYPDGAPVPNVLLLATLDGVHGSVRADTDQAGAFEFAPCPRERTESWRTALPMDGGCIERFVLRSGPANSHWSCSAGVGSRVAQCGPTTAKPSTLGSGSGATPGARGQERAARSARPGSGVAGQTRARNGGTFEFDSLEPCSDDLVVQSEDQAWFGRACGVLIAAGAPVGSYDVLLYPAAVLVVAASPRHEARGARREALGARREALGARR